MESQLHDLPTLFDQLGLDNNQDAITRFIRQHAPLDPAMPLHQAQFWNPSQARFLQQAKRDDADWCEVVDLLDVMLRSHYA